MLPNITAKLAKGTTGAQEHTRVFEHDAAYGSGSHGGLSPDGARDGQLGHQETDNCRAAGRVCSVPNPRQTCRLHTSVHPGWSATLPGMAAP